MTQEFTVNRDVDGIAMILFDSPTRSMNILHAALVQALAAEVERLAADPTVKGVIVTSCKRSFIAGYDLAEIGAQLERKQTAAERYVSKLALSGLYRRIETCGKPFAAAVNGLALGGGFELALACHYRVLAHEPDALVGLPQVKVGLLPGAGGTQRLPRLIGIEKALPILLDGDSVSSTDALKLGIVSELALRAEVVSAARRWLLGNPVAQQPWDQKGFRVPGGTNILLPGVAQGFIMGTALAAKNTSHNYPAPVAILSAVYEGVQLPIEKGLDIETKYLSQLLASPVARNLIRTMFINKRQADKLVRRPAGVPKSQVCKIGVLGAGMMGRGIAYVSAAAGMEVVLLDSTTKLAERGKSHSASLLERVVEAGRDTQAHADEVLTRIQATSSYADLAGCDLVVEAVVESRSVKADVTKKAEAAVGQAAVFASNTSTLPIGGLAEASQCPAHFVGVHFFSPVDKMPLVEIILGRHTSEETLARALDYVGQIGKTPIVVNDSRGFYTSRCFGTFIAEGQCMLEEGIGPALIENAARQTGMPVGPLAVSDEVSLDLQYQVFRQTAEDIGAAHSEPINWKVVHRFVVDLRRPGRAGGGGFYDYPAGAKKHLWPGLAEQYPLVVNQPPVAEVKTRLLYIQALEAARAFEEGVVMSAAEADLGSILGWGFPAWTGGVLSFIDTIGVGRFVAQCQQLAKVHGPRFQPPAGLLARAAQEQPFHAPIRSDTGAAA
jgi:3-hydroxyacyl-CoA dehydrogenase/enoyl-CoA hydratase/3-hydroxybutyryl-CoA epimerase